MSNNLIVSDNCISRVLETPTSVLLVRPHQIHPKSCECLGRRASKSTL